MTTNSLHSLGDTELLASTRAHVLRSNIVEADLVALLGEVEERKLHLERAFPTMFEFCTRELGMSEGVAANRLYVARLARRLPVVLEWLRSGRIHLSGLRVLCPHLTETNCTEVLTEAAGMSKRALEELVTRFAPKPPVPTTIRALPIRAAPVQAAPPQTSSPASASPAFELTAPRPPPRIEPLAPNSFRVTLTIDGTLRKKVDEALDLMRHRVAKDDVAEVLEQALDLLIEKVKKERFGVGRKPRAEPAPVVPGEGAEGSPHVSRNVPAAVRRAVYERDGGRCTFVSSDGRRCAETGGLQFEHLDGFAITREHSAARIVLMCGPHNRHAAERLYGREEMARVKNSLSTPCPGACEQEALF